MKLKKALAGLAVAAAMAVGGVAASSGTASATVALWELHHDMTMPKHTVGTSCTTAQANAYTLGRTKWGTVIGCGFYLKNNKQVAHWTYLWFKNDGSGDVWASDGWLYPYGSRPAVYVGNIFAIPV